MRRHKITILTFLVTSSTTLLLFFAAFQFHYDDIKNYMRHNKKLDLEFTKPDLNKIPVSLHGLITSLDDLKGRHSDFITADCQSQGQQPKTSNITHTKKEYGFIGPFDYLPQYKNPCWLNQGSQSIKCVPYVYLLGAPKAASSDLFAKLITHPQILSGRNKESRWFDFYRYEDPTRSGWNYFVKFFEGASKQIQDSVANSGMDNKLYQQKIIADGDPHYYFRSMHWQEVPGNEGCLEPRVTLVSQLHRLWPDAKLLLILRQPVTRLYLAYLYNAIENHTNRTSAQFHKLVETALFKWYKCLAEHTFRFCMYDERNRADKMGAMMAGIYSRYVLDILKLFPRKQLYVIRTEDYSNNMRETLKGIHSFLGVQPLPDSQIPNGTNIKVNRGNGYSKAGHMWEKTRKLLDDFYAPYNQELADILNDKRFLWLDTVVEVE